VTTSQAFSITIVMNASVPGAPTIGSATAGNAQATVAFTPPTANGGLPVTSYTATCGAFSAAGASSPLIVTGLTNGIAYSCVVTATNAVGTGPASAAASVTPIGPAIGPGEAVQVPTLSQWAIILLALLLGFAALAFRPRC